MVSPWIARGGKRLAATDRRSAEIEASAYGSRHGLKVRVHDGDDKLLATIPPAWISGDVPMLLFSGADFEILAVFAELERKMISQRTREALALRKRKGQATSCYPGCEFNWERRWDRDALKYVKIRVEDPEERPVMREIVRWRLGGHSWEAIRKHIVYNLKLVTKDRNPWTKSRIMRTFQAELRLRAIRGTG